MLGKPYSAVTKALGKPQHRALRKGYGSIRYGTLQDRAWPLSIYFRRRAGALRAWSIAIASPQAVESRLGKILRLKPKVIQSRIFETYRDDLRLTESYSCRRRPLRCRGEFERVGDEAEVAFGLLFPGASSQGYITIYR